MNAKALKRMRRAVGFTQQTLSGATGLTETKIAFVETGRLKLTREEVELIRAAIQKRLAEATELIGAPMSV